MFRITVPLFRLHQTTIYHRKITKRKIRDFSMAFNVPEKSFYCFQYGVSEENRGLNNSVWFFEIRLFSRIHILQLFVLWVTLSMPFKLTFNYVPRTNELNLLKPLNQQNFTKSLATR